jgi:hypothetical protein
VFVEENLQCSFLTKNKASIKHRISFIFIIMKRIIVLCRTKISREIGIGNLN